jgi:hypothetical protein
MARSTFDPPNRLANALKIASLGFVFFLGLFAMALSAGELTSFVASQNWDTTAGTIRSAQVSDDAPNHLEVSYIYFVGNERLEGNKVAFGLVTGDDAERKLANYSPGTRVEVTYNPDEPATAVLDRFVNERVLIGMIAGAVLAVLSGFALLAIAPEAGGLWNLWSTLLFALLLAALAMIVAGLDEGLSISLIDLNAEVILLLMVMLLFVVFGLAGLLYVLEEGWFALRAGGWQETPGEVRSVQAAGEDGPPGIEYVYEAERHIYSSRRMMFGDFAPVSFAGPSPAEMAADYQAGQHVTVYHHPEDPRHATLERRAHPMLLAWLGISLLATLLLGGGMVAMILSTLSV